MAPRRKVDHKPPESDTDFPCSRRAVLLAVVLRKVPVLFVTAAAVMFLTFLLMHMAPGDALDTYLGQEGATSAEKAEIKAKLGLDQPVYVQFTRYVGRLTRGDLGSIPGKGSVSTIIKRRFAATARLAVAAILISILVGVAAGLISGWRHGSAFDRWTQATLVVFVSAPIFWSGLLAMLVFSWALNVFPAAGSDGLAALVLPAVTLGMRPAALVARVARSSAIDVKYQTYIVAARGRGVSEGTILLKHVLKVIAIPVVTIVGMDFASLLSGAVITETVFSYQGLGQFAVEAISNRWYDAVMAVALVWGIVFVGANFVVDMSYSFLDPRTRKAAA
jgi:peptide/nickel transport system permease protein